MKLNSKILLFSFSLAAFGFAGCNDRLEEYTQVSDAALSNNLFQKIEADPNLRTFADLLRKTGYDKEIASSKKYTVWAPTNQALAGLDAGILNNEARLKEFVGNHIVLQSYFTNSPKPELRLKTLNGKHVKFYNDRVEDAAISAANQFVGNGVLHIVDKALVPKPNVWEFVMSGSGRQRDLMQAMAYTTFDPSKAEQIGVEQSTGKPIYKEGTGEVARNYLFDKTGELTNEDQEYTLILLTDEAIEAERAKLRNFTKGATPAESERLASVYVMKDLVIKGLYTPDNLPAFLTSEDGVRIPIDRQAIISHHYTSNGIVYVMSAADVALQDKILPVRVEGEHPAGFSRTDRASNISYRLRRNPNTQELFNDIYIFNHKVNLFHARYEVPTVYSGTYKVYWVAPNDVQTITFSQRFAVNDPKSTHFQPTLVPLKNFDEVYVGEFTVENLSDLKVYIVGADNGVDGQNSISLDYFKLVPQLP